MKRLVFVLVLVAAPLSSHFAHAATPRTCYSDPSMAPHAAGYRLVATSHRGWWTPVFGDMKCWHLVKNKARAAKPRPKASKAPRLEMSPERLPIKIEARSISTAPEVHTGSLFDQLPPRIAAPVAWPGLAFQSVTVRQPAEFQTLGESFSTIAAARSLNPGKRQ
jgi:hypothetical protein